MSIDPKMMSLSDGSQMQFMPNFPPPRSWQVDDVVELEELKMKMYRITNRSQHQTQAQAMLHQRCRCKKEIQYRSPNQWTVNILKHIFMWSGS